MKEQSVKPVVSSYSYSLTPRLVRVVDINDTFLKILQEKLLMVYSNSKIHLLEINRIEFETNIFIRQVHV